jgi:hypothetical protein
MNPAFEQFMQPPVYKTLPVLSEVILKRDEDKIIGFDWVLGLGTQVRLTAIVLLRFVTGVWL